MEVKFVKMHGAGNDFVMIDDREETFPLDDYMRVAAMASRPGGIGCEGVILVQKSSRADFRMRFFNPDGSEAELCGNGARCVAAFARAIGAVRGSVMCFETNAGLVDAEIVAENLVKVWMPDPRDLRAGFVNSGVPHRVVEVENLASADVEGEGRRIRMSDEFAPEGTNVDFAVFRKSESNVRWVFAFIFKSHQLSFGLVRLFVKSSDALGGVSALVFHLTLVTAFVDLHCGG